MGANAAQESGSRLRCKERDHLMSGGDLSPPLGKMTSAAWQRRRSPAKGESLEVPEAAADGLDVEGSD